ncbi:hypothetical protein KBA39_03670 [Myxococcota bacterium]|nr:hypothetical protein [Myxococcota bacterium]
MLMVLMALISVGRLKLIAARGWFWLLLSGGLLGPTAGCLPVMMYGPSPYYDEGSSEPDDSDVQDVDSTESTPRPPLEELP